MSQLRNNNSQRYNNSNVSGNYGRTGSSQSGAGRSGTGFVSLGGLPKRGRSGPGVSAAKLSIPKPVNLPSLRKENAGNDPLSQIVQGGQGGWQKPEPEQPPPVQTERPSSLVGNSNWASRQQQDQASSFGQQPLVADSGYHTGYGARDRRLNPTEYPSLSAAAYAAQQQQTKQLQQQATNASQATGQWDEDERHGPVAPSSRLQDPPDWDGVADDRDLQFGRPDAFQAPSVDRGYKYNDRAYRPSAGPDYNMPARESDQYPDGRGSGGYGGRREYGQTPSYAQDSSRSQHPQHGSDAYFGQRTGSRAAFRDTPPEARPYDDQRWSRDGPSARDSRSPLYADRPPSYSERPPSYAERPPSYAERPPSYAEWRPSYVERPSYADRPRPSQPEQPSRLEEPAYRPLPAEEYIPIIDEALFPPPPPPMRGQLGSRSGDGSTLKDSEREAFNAELDRIAAAREEERQRKREAPPAPASPAEEAPGLSKDAAAAESSAAMAVAAGEVAAATAQAQAAVPGSEEHKTAEAAVAKAKMKFKPLIDEEDERRRASAAAKLRALDEAIAKRKAEEERKRAEEEAAAALQAEAEAALLAEQAAVAAAAAAEAVAAAEPAEEEEQEPLLPKEAEVTLTTASTELPAQDTFPPAAEAHTLSLKAPSVEVEVASTVAAPASLLDSFSEEAEELLPEISTPAAAAEPPKPPVNAWAKPLVLPNGQTASAWQAATAPTPAEAAHQASAQALGLSSSQGRKVHASQDVRLDSADMTPNTWDEPAGQVPQQRSQSWQNRQQGEQQGRQQAGWRHAPQQGDSLEGLVEDAMVDGHGLADRGRGRGGGRGRGRNREGPASREGAANREVQPLQQVAEGDTRFRGDRPERGRGRSARGRGTRAGRQREFAKEEQEKFAAKAAADAAASQALGASEPLAVDAWGDPTSGPAPPAQPQANEHTHKRQQHPRVREQVAKRGRNRGPASRPGSAASKAKPEGEDTSTAVPPASAPAPAAGTVASAAQHLGGAASSTAPSAPSLPQAQPSSAASNTAASSTAFNWVKDDSAAQVASSIAQLNLDKPVSLSPVLDPVARHPGASADAPIPDLRGFQIERPSSTKVTAVSRPRSASLASDPFSASPNTDLPNGMPALPADLTFDSVLDKPSVAGPSAKGPNINFGHVQTPQPNQAMDRLHPGAFPAALFPITSQCSNRPGATWQPPPPPEQAPNPQPNLAAAVESFYAARAVGSSSGFGGTGAAAFSGGPPTANPSANPPLNLPQFGSFGAGSFGTGLQFGQLGDAFGQSPFIPTGKQPDWSTGPIPGNPNPPPQPAAAFTSRPADNIPPPGLGPFNARNHPGMPNATAPGSALRQGGLPSNGPAAGNLQPSAPAAFVAPFDAAAGLPDDVFDEPKQKPADNQQQQQQQRMPNGSYRGRGDPRRGRGRNDGPPGRGYRGGRGGQGPQGMQFNPPLDAAPNNPMAAGNPRSQDFNRDTARPQRMANEGGSQGQGRGMPFGRGNARGGGSYRGRGGRSNNAQKAQAVKPAGEDSKPGPVTG